MSKDIKELFERYREIDVERELLRREIFQQINIDESTIPPRFNLYRFIESNRVYFMLSLKSDYVGRYEAFSMTLTIEEVIEIVRNGITIDYDYIKEHHK